MKKCAIAAVVLMAATLTACGGGNASNTADSANSTPDTTSTRDTTSTPAPPASSSATGSPSTPASSSGTGSSSGGSNSGSDYCSKLRAAKAQFDSLKITTLSNDTFQKVTDQFDNLTSAAPSAVAGDWQTLSSALHKVQQILASANLSFDDLQTLTSGHRPPGVTIKQLDRVGKELTKFSTDKSFSKAANAISADAKAECGLTLGK